MRIKKISQTTPTQAQVVDGYSTSTTDSYSANYVNTAIAGIIESGSNANGNYIKFADGTAICWIEKTVRFNLNAAWGSLYTDGGSLGDLPITLTSFGFATASTTAPLILRNLNTNANATTKWSSVSVMYYSQLTNYDATIRELVIGKWK